MIQKHGTNQLAMFMTAPEIMSQYQALDADREFHVHSGVESDEALYERKYHEARRGGLAQSIEQEGVRKPIHLGEDQIGSQGKPSVVGGHHRLATMAHTNPEGLIPVLHHVSILHAKFGGAAAFGGYS